MSPRAGELDEAAFAQAAAEDADSALALLADMAGATDPALRELARRLAGRVMVRYARSGPPRSSGTGRIGPAPAGPDADLDLDASVDAVLAAASQRRPPHLDELAARGWVRPSKAMCLVVDRSGSMGGSRLATAALAAAALAWRAPDDYSVVAFSSEVVVVKGQRERRPVEAVVDDLLGLRGHGTTDLAAGLTAAAVELEMSTAAARTAVLLSDGRPTVGGDPEGPARRLPELCVAAPEGDSEEAVALARRVGARWVTIAGPTDVPGALAKLVGS